VQETNQSTRQAFGGLETQASTTFLVLSSNDFGSGCGNGLLLALCGASPAVTTEDDLAFLVCGAKAICDCGAPVRLRQRLLLSGSSREIDRMPCSLGIVGAGLPADKT
jgi:hypothetical protein